MDKIYRHNVSKCGADDQVQSQLNQPSPQPRLGLGSMEQLDHLIVHGTSITN